MNRSLGLTAGTQAREPHLLPSKLKTCHKLPFSPSLVPCEARLPQSIPLGPTGLSSPDSAWDSFPQEKLPCSAPGWKGGAAGQGRGCRASELMYFWPF